ncbi:hypothetical protein GUJ93_ZPchr0001g30091 [Zizania palustris]|uniref:Uncharacterized protein n=1 Tax=Zizania palustris TaxID=103762 RepID=A0A8J5S8A0_ZIZPA|nr:hypothetical protein GUJ93_ZPchr0001g30091 [Zizania palustris]
MRQSTGKAATQERLQRGRGGTSAGLQRGCDELQSCASGLWHDIGRGGGRSSSSTGSATANRACRREKDIQEMN